MKLFKDLFRDAYPDLSQKLSLPDFSVSGIECDSRNVEPGAVFVAIQGTKKNGNDFIEEAVRRGAAVIVADREDGTSVSVPRIIVPEARMAASKLAASFFDNPSKKMRVVGITGTNGKTTTSYLLEYLLSCQRATVGVIGTVNYRYPGKEIPATETTPGPVKLQAMLAEMAAYPCDYAVMEVSSHALDQERAGAIAFECGLFTNLTQDHLDYHKTMEEYFRSKSKLFLGLSPNKTALLNADDLWVRKLSAKLSCSLMTFGIKTAADLHAKDLTLHSDRTAFGLVVDGKTIPVEMSLAGVHNVYNALGAFAVLRALGMDLRVAAADLRRFPGVPGRLERVEGGQDFTIFVDFAHTPDGLENVLRAVSPYKKRKLILVFGCGGDRDRTKRPKMAAIAAETADFIYVTSDNPRSENPRMIAEEIVKGFPESFKNYAVVLDRAKAIRQALLAARRGDIVLLAGKGHERTQVLSDKTLAFSDKEEAENILHGH